MGEKTIFLDVEDTLLRYDAAVVLRKLADDLAQGVIMTDAGEIAVGGTLKMECKGKMKPKADASKGSIKIELSWSAPAA